MRKLLLQRAVLPLAAALTPFKSHRYLQVLLDADFAPLSAQEDRREALLRELVDHARRETALYAERLPGGAAAAVPAPCP